MTKITCIAAFFALLSVAFLAEIASADVHASDYVFCNGGPAGDYGYCQLAGCDSEGYGGKTQVCVDCSGPGGGVMVTDCILM